LLLLLLAAVPLLVAAAGCCCSTQGHQVLHGSSNTGHGSKTKGTTVRQFDNGNQNITLGANSAVLL
jgi:hypothetical protein